MRACITLSGSVVLCIELDRVHLQRKGGMDIVTQWVRKVSGPKTF